MSRKDFLPGVYKLSCIGKYDECNNESCVCYNYVPLLSLCITCVRKVNVVGKGKCAGLVIGLRLVHL